MWSKRKLNRFCLTVAILDLQTFVKLSGICIDVSHCDGDFISDRTSMGVNCLLQYFSSAQLMN